jgi:hypothetical protein
VSIVMLTAIALMLGGLSRATAANILVLSTGNAQVDSAIQGGGHTVDIGPPYTEFTGTSLPNYDAVVLVPSFNYAAGDMPEAGQNALNYFVSVAGGGLVTGEWTVWPRAFLGHFTILYDSLPVVATAALTAP